MGRDKTSYAYIRNRAESSHLQSELQRIEREKQDEMRILNTEKRRFRTKYSKLSSKSTRPAIPFEGLIYETHEPGFRHQRKAETKPAPGPDSPTDFDKIREMVFTDGAVDIDKIACLHLLSAYRSETLSPPKKKALTCKEHSPTERLIDRSKKGFLNNETISSILPLYTIEPVYRGTHGDVVIRDGRLAARILVNKTIRDLISAVVSALQISNHAKLADLCRLGRDPDSLKGLFEKKHIQEFVDLLSELPLLSYCDSFVLTPPFKMKSRDLNVRTSTGSVEALVRSVRQNVLQSPSRKLLMGMVEEERPVSSELRRNMFLKSAGQWKSESMMKHIRETPESNKILEASVKSGKRVGRHVSINFINKNIEEASKARKIQYEIDDDEDIFTSRNQVRLSVPKLNIRKTGSPRSERSDDSVSENAKGDESFSRVTSPKISMLDSKMTDDGKPNNPKYLIKRTTCPACMEKWKTPLPSPKTPRVKRSKVLQVADNLKTDSIHRIDMLINKEMYLLESYDRRFSSSSNSFRRWCGTEKKVMIMNAFKCIGLSSVDLTRIHQEVKQKETQRKLDMFLGQHSDNIMK